MVLLLTGERSWKEIVVDFIGELPESGSYNAILVITDRFTKMQYYMFAKTSWTSNNIANAYHYNVQRLHRLSNDITSNRRPLFILAFSRVLDDKLGIKLLHSTAHYPQTDSLSKRTIQMLKQYLYIFCYNRQDRWALQLSLAEYTYNSTSQLMGTVPSKGSTGST